jgi:hypothetical protein
MSVHPFAPGLRSGAFLRKTAVARACCAATDTGGIRNHVCRHSAGGSAFLKRASAGGFECVQAMPSCIYMRKTVDKSGILDRSDA